ncbi:hypothetical protein MVEN_02347900 [Mycena venus]|uniref:Uncharacterized protein n=1 Tax=Mycena venus TaxID=2733690 RepID=A0A8H7CEA8_9AGAR|nr:hypothetical protein MVEN_02347900 [Mycena venus]
MQYNVHSGAFDSHWYFMINHLLQTAVSLLLYSIYINLFLFSLHTLSRRKAVGTKLLIVASCIMAVVSSAQMALDVAINVAEARLLQQIVHLQISEHSLMTVPLWTSTLLVLQTAQRIIFAMNNFLTDAFFLYRCYIIWGFQKKPLILPGLLMLATLVMGIFSFTARNADTAADSRISYSLAVATNLVLTALTAGRILWIRREASHVLVENAFRSRYNRAIGVILESGMIYCLAVIFLVIGDSLNVEILSIGFGIAQQLLNIIPTFTLVYIGLSNTNTAGSSHNVISNYTPSRSAMHTVYSSGPSSAPAVLYITKVETEGREMESV